MTINRRSGTERGSTALFFAAVVLPILFFVFSVSLDLGQYFREMQRAQKITDDGVRYAARFLPFPDAARRAAENYLVGQGQDLQQFDIQVSTRFSKNGLGYDSLSIEAHKSQSINFAKLLGASVALPVSAFARARVVPTDALLLIDVSGYMGPDISRPNSWGEVSSWPAAQFFQSGRADALFGQNVPDPRVLTQQCFNEALSPLKVAAIRAIDYISAFKANAFGVGFFPAGARGLEIIREVKISDSAEPVSEVSASRTEPQPFSSTLCAVAADEELSAIQYRLPKLSEEFVAPKRVSVSPVAYPPDFVATPDFISALQAREAIWTRPIRGHEVPSISRVLAEVQSNLFGTQSVPSRGAIDSASRKLALIFAGDVPYELGKRFPDGASAEAMRVELLRLASLVKDSTGSFSLIYALPEHRGNSSSDFGLRVAAMHDLMREIENTVGLKPDKFSLNFLTFDSVEDFSHGAVEAATKSGQRVILSR